MTLHTVGYFKILCPSHHTIWNGTFNGHVTLNPSTDINTNDILKSRVAWPHYSTLWETLVHTHTHTHYTEGSTEITLHGRKHRDGFAYEEVWASPSPFLCCSQLVTDTWQRHRTEARQKTEKERMSNKMNKKNKKKEIPFVPPLYQNLHRTSWSVTLIFKLALLEKNNSFNSDAIMLSQLNCTDLQREKNISNKD